MQLQFTGVVQSLSEITTVWAKSTQKQSIVIKEDIDNYAQSIQLDYMWAWVDKLNFVQVGDTVTADFKVTAKEYNGKVYNNLVWRWITIIKPWCESSEIIEDIPF